MFFYSFFTGWNNYKIKETSLPNNYYITGKNFSKKTKNVIISHANEIPTAVIVNKQLNKEQKLKHKRYNILLLYIKNLKIENEKYLNTTTVEGYDSSNNHITSVKKGYENIIINNNKLLSFYLDELNWLKQDLFINTNAVFHNTTETKIVLINTDETNKQINNLDQEYCCNFLF